MSNPLVGVGVVLENSDNNILVGQRIGSHAPHYSIPGGKIELGESFEEAAIREVYEETGISIKAPEVIGLTNNLKTFKKEKVHFISVILHARIKDQNPQVMEPEKCSSWQWVDPHQLPHPHFEASLLSVGCFLQNRFYIQKNYQL